MNHSYDIVLIYELLYCYVYDDITARRQAKSIYNIVELSERVRFLSLLRRNSRFGKIRLDNVIIVVDYNMEGYYDMVNSISHTEPNH